MFYNKHKKLHCGCTIGCGNSITAICSDYAAVKKDKTSISLAKFQTSRLYFFNFFLTVQSQDTNQAVQQERDRWIAERKRLMAELEEVRKGVVTPGQGVVTPGQGDIYQPNSMASSPPDRYNKSPSPVSEDENLELSMIKVGV